MCLLLAVYNITFLSTLDADLPHLVTFRKLINQNPVFLSLIQNNVLLGSPSFPFLHLWGGGEEKPQLAILTKSIGGWERQVVLNGKPGMPSGVYADHWHYNKILLDTHVHFSEKCPQLSSNSPVSLTKIRPKARGILTSQGLFMQVLLQMCLYNEFNPQPSTTWFHPTGFTHQNEFAHFNGKSEWVQFCQKSCIIIIISLLLHFPHEILRPEARDPCIPSTKLHKAKAVWTQKKFTVPIYETRFIKISLQVRNGHLTVHIYTHVQEGSSVSSFPGRSPSQPRVLSRVMYHRYNSPATTRALVRQRPLFPLFSKSHDSVKVILPIIIHISRGFRHAGYSDGHRQQNQPQSQNKNIRHMYKR